MTCRVGGDIGYKNSCVSSIFWNLAQTLNEIHCACIRRIKVWLALSHLLSNECYDSHQTWIPLNWYGLRWKDTSVLTVNRGQKRNWYMALLHFGRQSWRRRTATVTLTIYFLSCQWWWKEMDKPLPLTLTAPTHRAELLMFMIECFSVTE